MLAPRIPAISGVLGKKKPGHKMANKEAECRTGNLQEDVYREGAIWRSTGRSEWRGNREMLPRIPAVRRLPAWWDVNDEGEPAQRPSTPIRIRTRDSTMDEKRCKAKIEAGHEPTEVSQAEEDPMRAGIPTVKWQPEQAKQDDAEAEEFGSQILGFPTERRPTSYRRQLLSQTTDSFDKWIEGFPKMIGELAKTPEQIEQARSLLATCQDIFVENIRDMPKTDLIEHRIPIYRDAMPSVAKPVLYSSEEVEWQNTNIPKLLEAGIVTQCVSPWSARSRFPRKENGTLRMVHAFMKLNGATIKANYPMRRIEPILKKIGAPWLSYFFKTDASNGYWAVGIFPPHAYRLAFSTVMGQMCYLRMGQGCTGGPGTYTQLKDIVTSSIPGPDSEPALSDAMPQAVAFDHFVDDDIGGADSFSNLVTFLHEHYFPRLAWAKLTLNPSKCTFFVPRVKILGHQRDGEGIKPSEDKLGQFREWPTPTNKDELMRFLNTLPFLRAFIPGRADYTIILRSAIIEESVTVKRDGRQTTTKTNVDFIWTKRHQDAFDAVKQSVIEGCNSGGNDEKQYHLCTDASKTGAGGLLFQLENAETGTPLTKALRNDISSIMFMSYQFTPAQTRYHTTERECLAVVKALAEVRWIVKGSKYPLILYTDHQALLKLLRSEDATGRIARWQLSLSEYDLDIYHVPGRDLAVADGLSRLDGYPSRAAEEEESTMASFLAEASIGNQTTAGDIEPTRKEGLNAGDTETGDTEPGDTEPTRQEGLTAKWEEWLDDPWYGQVVEYLLLGVCNDESTLADSIVKIIKQKSKSFVLVENDDKPSGLAFRERSGQLARCLHAGDVHRKMGLLHNLHGHFAEQITMKRCIGKFYWPTRYKDIFAFCRSCPMCQMIGPLRPTKGLLPVVSIQVGDILAFDYIGPITPIAKSGARFIGLNVDYFSRFLFGDAVSQATSSNSVQIMENKVVDKIGYPRAVYSDNGSHFKRFFSQHLKQKGVKQYFAPITHPQSVGLAERYVQLVLNIFRAILQHHPHLIFEWDLLLPTVIRSANTRYIKIFGFSPAEILLGFNPRYEKGSDEFEDILRSQAVESTIDTLMSKEQMSIEEANYESRLARIDEIRDRAMSRRLVLSESTISATRKREGNPDTRIKTGSLVRLRRTAQDNQHSHKLEPRWEGPYRVHKMAGHGQSAWIEELHSGKVKGRYHVNALSFFLDGKEAGRKDELWKSVADINRQQRQQVLTHMKKAAKEKGTDDEPDDETIDPKFQRQQLGFPPDYGDEPDFVYWKNKAVDWNNFLVPERPTQLRHEGKGAAIGPLLNPI